jgi:hypothetical protein
MGRRVLQATRGALLFAAAGALFSLALASAFWLISRDGSILKAAKYIFILFVPPISISPVIRAIYEDETEEFWVALSFYYGGFILGWIFQRQWVLGYLVAAWAVHKYERR